MTDSGAADVQSDVTLHSLRSGDAGIDTLLPTVMTVYCLPSSLPPSATLPAPLH